jgi:SAM-dependent methyltransferase
VGTVGCRKCGFVQSNPRPDARGLEVFYRDHYRHFYQGVDTPDAAYISTLNKDARLSYTSDFFRKSLGLKDEAVILDFGCGEGSLFAALRKAGFTAAFYGVELNANFGAYASQFGDATVSNAINASEPIDLAIVNHVLEHLADPIGTLRQLGTLLSPSGRIYIDVPDVEEYQGIEDLHIAHIYHFSERTLAQLVSRAGFLIEKTEKHAPPHHPRSIRLVARFDPDAQPIPLGTAAQETFGWDAVRRSGSFVKTVRLRLRKLTVLRKAYQASRQLLGR